MRTPLIAANLCLAMILGLALAACKDRPQDAPVAADPATETPAPATATPASTATTLEDDLVASTNEPFWQAQVAGPVLTLRGIDGERQLAIGTSDTADDTRTLRASDAAGLVELKVTATPCQDTMSGAQFPYSAVLVIDGGTPIIGCARPASMPPPGEPQ